MNPIEELEAAIRDYLEAKGRFACLRNEYGMAGSAGGRVFADYVEALSEASQVTIAGLLVSKVVEEGDQGTTASEAASMILACCIRGLLAPFSRFRDRLESELHREEQMRAWLTSDDSVKQGYKQSWQYCLSLISILTFVGSDKVVEVVQRVEAHALSENFRFAARQSYVTCRKRLEKLKK